MVQNINVVCFKWGDAFSADYVNKLRDSLYRNSSVPINFICYTEDRTGIDPFIDCRPFLCDLPTWWYIIGLFNPAHNFKGRTVYFDLDTVFTGNIDHILKVDKPFVTLRDFYRTHGLQTAYISWDEGVCTHIWEKFLKKRPINLLKASGGTNRFLEQAVGTGSEVPRIQDIFPNDCISYKVHIKNNPNPVNPEDAKIVFFHGKPRPEEVASLDWMKKHWR